MASEIKLTNAEILDYGQSTNFAGAYQFGRTISLNITAFIHPITPSGTFAGEGAKFKKIDILEQKHIEEILAKGFVDRIEIGPDTPQVIENVKILSYSFRTSTAINNKITLLRVNMALEYYEAFDNKSFLTEADAEIYDNIEFLDPSIYAQYFDSFVENFSFSISDDYALSYNHSFNFSLRPSSSADIDLVQKAKELVHYVFAIQAPKVGYIDDRYKNFIRDVSEKGNFNETYDSLNNSYSFTKSVTLKKGAYQTSQKKKKWSADLNYDIRVDPLGVVTITESGAIQGRLGLNEGPDFLYKNAYDGLVELTGDISVMRARSQSYLEEFIKVKPDWIEGEGEWNVSDDLAKNFVSFGKKINRIAGSIDYTAVFTTSPRLHNDAIFQYTITASKSENNITTVVESGSITPYYTNKNELFSAASGSTVKDLYDKMTGSTKVLERIKPLYDSTKDVSRSAYSLSFPKNLISKNISFNSYGVGIKYTFSYQDDKTLRNSTYLRKIEQLDNYEFPVIQRQSFTVANNKTTNFDANQSTTGSKTISLECILKRDPAGNTINTNGHALYIKTASDSVFDSLRQETEKSAFVQADQSKSNSYNFFLNNVSYTINSGYDLNYSVSLGFVDKRGVVAESLKY